MLKITKGDDPSNSGESKVTTTDSKDAFWNSYPLEAMSPKDVKGFIFVDLEALKEKV